MITRLSRALAILLLAGASGAVLAQPDQQSPITAADTVFLQDAAASGVAEIQLGQMALGTASDDKVKALAQSVVDDHTKADDALKSLAASKKVSLPTAPTSDARKQSNKLKALTGSQFDEAWSKEMVQDHKDAIKEFTKEGKQTKDGDIQKFVTATLPALKAHLDAAQKLASVPDARDKAMDQATQSMGSAMDSMPGSAATSPAKPSATTIAPASAPAAAPAAKH